jgi:hypothetical protein
MLLSMLQSLLPDGFDMEQSIKQAQQFMLDVRVIADGVKQNTEILQRIEARQLAETVAYRETSATLPANLGERNADQSNNHGATGSA